MQNRLKLLFWWGLCLSLGFPGQVRADTLVQTVSISRDRLQLTSHGDLTRVELEGARGRTPAGAPDLPVMTRTVSLPPGHTLQNARVVIEEIEVLSGRHALARRDDPRSAFTVQGTKAAYPLDPVMGFRSGRMRGRSVAVIAVTPFRWQPDTGELGLVRRFRLELDTEARPLSTDDFVVLRESPEGLRTFGPAVAEPGARDGGGFVLTPTVNSGAPFAPGFLPTVDGSPVDMVIITTPDQEAEYQRLADFKTRIGISTVVRTVNWITANYPNGADTQETIRNFLKDAAAKWGTAWVLLGGDTDQVPIRQGYSHHRNGEDIPTDLYYSDLDRNWNRDGDALIGEGSGYSAQSDSVDLFPDVWVGRLPSNNSAEAKVMVDKTLTYLQNPPLDHLNDQLFLSEVLFPSNWVPGSGAASDGPTISEVVIDTLLSNHRPVRLYENHTVWPGAYPETKQAVVDSLNQGYHLVHFVGHGYINTMSVGLNAKTLTNADAEALTNGDKAFVLYAINCTSSAVDFNCIAEKFMSNPVGGAVSVLGTSEVEDAIVAATYNFEFFHVLFHTGAVELGRTLALSKIPFIASSGPDNAARWAQFSQLQLGDPGLPFWTDVPTALTVTHDSTFALGQGQFTVTVTESGAPAESARVALFKKDDAYSVGYTDALGEVTLPFRPDETGTLSVGVFLANSLPYLGEAVVEPSMDPYLFARSQTVVDDGSGFSVGNGDGRIDAGETVEIYLSLENGGCATEDGIQTVLFVSNPDLIVVDGSSAFPALDPDSVELASDPIILQVSRNVEDRLEVPCTFLISGDSSVYNQEILLYVHAPIVDYWSQSIRDTIGTGNGDSVLTANEDFVILPTIRNTGLGNLKNAELRLRSSDVAVTITDSVIVLGDVSSGDFAGGGGDGFSARMSDVATEHAFEIILLDAYDEVFSRSLDLIPPPVPQNLLANGSDGAISLQWDPVDHDDLRGYAVYRAATGSGPFVRINTWTTEATAYYEDSGLPGLTQQYYRVAAVDSSGNTSSRSLVISASTTLPLHPGWPVELGTSTPGGAAIADLDGDGNLEVLAASDETYVVTADGLDFYDGDINAQTLGPIQDTGGARFWNTPAVGDVDRDGDEEIASVGWDDGLLHLVDATGTPLSGWPKDINPLLVANPNPIGSATLGDIDNDGDLEIFAIAGKVIFGWHHDGTEIIDGDADGGTDGVMAVTGSNFSYSTPTVANIDAEPFRELVAGMRDGSLYVFDHDGTPYPGFPLVLGGNITSSPAVGDVDQDGSPEIVFASSDSTLHVLRADKSYATGFPRTVPFDEDWDPSPALGDLNGDTYLDIVIGSSDHQVYAFSGLDGNLLTGFPVLLQSPLGTASTRSSAVLADVTGNGSVDIVLGDRDGWLHGFNAFGQPLPGFPIQTGNRIDGAALVWDVDGDGLVEVVVESFDQRLYCWDSPWTFNPALAYWPMFKGNQFNSGEYGAPPLTDRTVGVPEGAPLPRLLGNFPNPFSRATAVIYRVPDHLSYPAVLLEIFDMNGRLVRTLVDGEQPPGTHEVRWDGRDNRGRPAASGIYPYRLRIAGSTRTQKMILLRR